MFKIESYSVEGYVDHSNYMNSQGVDAINTLKATYLHAVSLCFLTGPNVVGPLKILIGLGCPFDKTAHWLSSHSTITK